MISSYKYVLTSYGSMASRYVYTRIQVAYPDSCR